ncbi:MAG: TonB-dependent receptor [Casimicrobiaceae bacterium]|nr:TonB-dependent receptor [Casimicrobiaceae bacterium]
MPRLKPLAQCVCLALLTTAAFAQSPEPTRVERVEITGSIIKRVQTEGALPVQVVTKEQLDRAGIVSAEQFIQLVPTFGNDLDNLASTSEVLGPELRGKYGLSAANLRGQGADATLVLLNGRRLAIHGLGGGSAVNLNQIPMAAVERIEILKDGASAIYGTDAIGGVVNFILRKDYQGFDAQGTIDVTEAGGGNIYRAAVSAGFGSLARDRYNVLFSLMHREHKILRGADRDFVNTFQPERGLHVDTRGAPFATAFAITSIRTILSSRNVAGQLQNGLGPLEGNVRMNGINALNMPGMPGCESIPGMADYDEALWALPSGKYGCAWDTGKAGALQQPVSNSSGVFRASFQLAPTLSAFVEGTAAKVKNRMEFSNIQVSSSTASTSPFFNLVYPATGASYNYVFNAIARLFPSIEENRGQPIAFRWRCMPCGPRQIETNTETARLVAGLEGSWNSWDYKAGVSHAFADSFSILHGGYYFGDKLAALIRSGTLNPFVPPGQSQTPEALAGLAAASATGTKLYGGKSSVTQADASVSGPIAKLPAGEVFAAVGIDLREEKYRFNGTETDLAIQRNIPLAPFDAVNDLRPVKRDVRAAYLELAVPVIKDLEVTAAVRHDRYTGFGGTTNPKFTLRYNPTKELLLRGSYNEGFRVPTFGQLFFGVTESPYAGRDLVDPFRCPSLVVDANNPNCVAINPTTLSGGKPNLRPETAKQWSVGLVAEPLPWLSAAVDYWHIRRLDNIRQLPLATLLQNASLFPEAFIRDASGNLVTIDQRWVNTGEQLTRGIEVSLRTRHVNLWGGALETRLEGTYLIERKSRLLQNQPFGPNEVGRFSRNTELPIRWKHVLSATYTRGPWSATLMQKFSRGYYDNVLPGVANGTVKPPLWSAKTADYSVLDWFVTYRGFRNWTLNAGIKNLLDRDPPFSAYYDSSTGGGSSWDPRVADPRGRAYVISASYSFK